MIELIGIVACIIACIFTPIQTAKIRTGWVPPKYKGTAAEYRAAHLKQLNWLMWAGLGFGVLTAGIAVLPTDDPPGEWIVKAVSAALWFTLSALCFFSKRSLATPVPAAH